jgi:signal transduction histidine kinase
MLDALREYFSTADFMPHGHCFLWKPPLVALHVGSDALIGTAYVVISLTLWQLVRRIRLPFSPMILAFGVFIGACGLTHYMEILTLWEPQYWLSGDVKALTAVASVATGAYLLRARPTIVRVTESARVSEERRVELEVKNRELEALYAQVKQLDEAKTQFFANASHELRTPLALVLGPVEKLLASDLPPGAREELELARRNARVLLRHVNDLLDAARLEEGRLGLHRAPADLAAVLRAVVEQFAGVARDRRVAVSVGAPAALPAEVDASQIERVLANLLGNAFKYVPDGGRVRASASAVGGRILLAVEDDGPGIAPEMREAVFERFRQDPGRPSRFGGAGLGLSISRDLVALHGGELRVRDSDLGGAQLEVNLPLSSAPGAGAGAPAAGGAAPAVTAADLADELRGRGRQPEPAIAPRTGAPVLVVEDNPDARRYVAEALVAEFRVETASDGREGIEKAEALRPDAVVTDLMMPGVPGETLVRELRGRPALADIPIIVLTARADQRQRNALLREGASDYVTKPFDPDELRARVRNVVAVKRARAVLAAELDARSGDLEALAAEVARRKRELEGALEAARIAREQAERASRVKGTFLSLVSHELRTPLTSIQLGIATLRSGRDGTLTERQAAAADRLERATARLIGLVESLLEYTRIESGRLVVRVEPVDLGAVASDVVEDVLPQAQRKLVALSITRPQKMPPVETDPRLLRLVLVNLVVNAVKYTDAGQVHVEVSHARDGYAFEVRDTGHGIPDEECARMFEPFEQLTPGTSAGGIGLGLALVKRILDALGGTIQVESKLGAGTRFVVRLSPREQPSSAATTAPSANADR